MTTGKKIGLAAVIIFWLMSIYGLYLCQDDSREVADIIYYNMLVVMGVWGAKSFSNFTDMKKSDADKKP